MEKKIKKGGKSITKTTINIPDDLLFRFKLVALKEKRYMGDIVREFIEGYVEKKEEKDV